MLDSRTGLVPATNKAVKAARGTLRFVATGADAASVVAGIQSKLDGALSACALVGIDPENVATVGNLRAGLIEAQANIGASDASVSFEIAPRELHKRAHKNSQNKVVKHKQLTAPLPPRGARIYVSYK